MWLVFWTLQLIGLSLATGVEEIKTNGTCICFPRDLCPINVQIISKDMQATTPCLSEDFIQCCVPLQDQIDWLNENASSNVLNKALQSNSIPDIKEESTTPIFRSLRFVISEDQRYPGDEKLIQVRKEDGESKVGEDIPKNVKDVINFMKGNQVLSNGDKNIGEKVENEHLIGKVQTEIKSEPTNEYTVQPVILMEKIESAKPDSQQQTNLALSMINWENFQRLLEQMKFGELSSGINQKEGYKSLIQKYVLFKVQEPIIASMTKPFKENSRFSKDVKKLSVIDESEQSRMAQRFQGQSIPSSTSNKKASEKEDNFSKQKISSETLDAADRVFIQAINENPSGQAIAGDSNTKKRNLPFLRNISRIKRLLENRYYSVNDGSRKRTERMVETHSISRNSTTSDERSKEQTDIVNNVSVIGENSQKKNDLLKNFTEKPKNETLQKNVSKPNNLKRSTTDSPLNTTSVPIKRLKRPPRILPKRVSPTRNETKKFENLRRKSLNLFWPKGRRGILQASANNTAESKIRKSMKTLASANGVSITNNRTDVTMQNGEKINNVTGKLKGSMSISQLLNVKKTDYSTPRTDQEIPINTAEPATRKDDITSTEADTNKKQEYKEQMHEKKFPDSGKNVKKPTETPLIDGSTGPAGVNQPSKNVERADRSSDSASFSFGTVNEQISEVNGKGLQGPSEMSDNSETERANKTPIIKQQTETPIKKEHDTDINRGQGFHGESSGVREEMRMNENDDGSSFKPGMAVAKEKGEKVNDRPLPFDVIDRMFLHLANKSMRDRDYFAKTFRMIQEKVRKDHEKKFEFRKKESKVNASNIAEKITEATSVNLMGPVNPIPLETTTVLSTSSSFKASPLDPLYL